MCTSLIEIGSKTAGKKSAQTNKQTDKQTNRHNENNGHLAVNQYKNSEDDNFTARRYASAVYAMALCLSDCLSQAGVPSKRLNISP